MVLPLHWWAHNLVNVCFCCKSISKYHAKMCLVSPRPTTHYLNVFIFNTCLAAPRYHCAADASHGRHSWRNWYWILINTFLLHVTKLAWPTFNSSMKKKKKKITVDWPHCSGFTMNRGKWSFRHRGKGLAWPAPYLVSLKMNYRKFTIHREAHLKALLDRWWAWPRVDK